MSQAELEQTTDTESSSAPVLEGGTYEIIRNRLVGDGNELRSRLEQLNAARKAVFGSIDTALIATDRVTTAHNCVPRDMVAIGDRFLFGYNVHFGLKSVTDLADVFAVYEFREGTFHEQSIDLLENDQFRKDFSDLYRFYKDARFAKFALNGAFLHMVFRIGKSVSDIKSFKWHIAGDQLEYIDSRSDHEVKFPPQHEFDWIRTHRDLHQSGRHPHIAIDDRIFVETVGGDLTIKVEDSTDNGEGIYSEPVDDPDQTLDDAEIYYALVGHLILLKIRPYREESFRYIVFNEKLQTAERIDSIESSCILLPDDHGLIFPHGYFLHSGESKRFDSQLENMLFERRIAAPNGEDHLFVFYNRESGTYILLAYNVIEQRVDTPIVCHGFTLFERGEFICFTGQDEPQKHHALQVWQTPFAAPDYQAPAETDSFLYKVGNRDIVRGMAECYELVKLIDRDETYGDLYVDLAKLAGEISDSYFWIGHEELFNLKEILTKLRGAATSAIAEFEKVVRVKQDTATQTASAKSQVEELVHKIERQRFEAIGEFVDSLAGLRRARGDVVSLRDLRYVDTDLVDSLEESVAEHADRLAQRCVGFLLRPDALDPYRRRVRDEQDEIAKLQKATDAKALGERIDESASELEMLIEIVSNLKIDDATQRTSIIDSISAIFTEVNQARAGLRQTLKSLMSAEGVAEFQSQLKLLNQSVANYLDICESPERCQEYLTKVMLQVEELEGRFAEFDEFILQLTEKRDEIYTAFETKRLALIEARNRRTQSLFQAAERILNGVQSRVGAMDSINDIHGYFAADLMIEKIRDIVDQLGELGDTVKVDDIQSRLKTIREDAVRQLKDRQELFVGGENLIQLGRHQFTVNTQELDLTIVNRDEELCLHLTGTNFFDPIDDVGLNDSRGVWNQEVVSETPSVYRGEYLASVCFQDLQAQGDSQCEAFLHSTPEEQLAIVQRFSGSRYSEAYTKGVHDHDATILLSVLLEMRQSLGWLRFHPRARALAATYWRFFSDKHDRDLITARARGAAALASLFPESSRSGGFIEEIRQRLASFVDSTGLFPNVFADEAAEYLFTTVAEDGTFHVSRPIEQLYTSFQEHLTHNDSVDEFERTTKSIKKDAAASLTLCRDWAAAFIRHQLGSTDVDEEELGEHRDELAIVLQHGSLSPKQVIEGTVDRDLSGLLGEHPLVQGGKYHLHYGRFHHKLHTFRKSQVPQFELFVERKKSIISDARDELRLEEFRPRVLTSFVRNKLIDTVYLPLIGDNLAKQMGSAGENKRTDLMGLLLLVSPPGYGKTTLMEYIANRLGLIFMKINGPALGHGVTSLDPSSADNAGAREELEKLNLALEMGDNIMLYLDDIQHCHPEFLQKFISLCDAQRKIEGVYRGKTRTYDLRGRKVAVVMAGNPYTESGERFQIPDMLSNRADIYNLGEIIGESADAFEMSYLENSLTSNPTLSKLASRSQKDVYSIIRMAEHGREGVSLEGNYSPEEVNEMVVAMEKLMRVRDVVLMMNREYIRSAAQSDDYRTEPPFKLQGSYRNMNRIAEKVVPIMNDEELTELIVSNYENDSQTLTSDTEANLLKFGELMELLTDEQQKRWKDIKRSYQQSVKLKGVGSDDKFGQVVVQLGTFKDGLDSIRDAMESGLDRLTATDDDAPVTEQLEGLRSGLDALRDSVVETAGTLAKSLEQQTESPQRPVPQPEPTPASPPVVVTPEGTGTTSTPATADAAQTITVVNRIPKTLLNVVQQQFNVMEGWLKPLLESSQLQAGQMEDLSELLQSCLKDYRRLLAGLDRARGKGSDDK